jgi:transposase InsO family protein
VILYDEEANLVTDLAEEVPTDLCWGALTGKYDGTEVVWRIDSAATRHMTYLRDVFSDYFQLKTPKIVRMANNGLAYGFGIGNVHVRVFTGDLRVETLILTDVLYVPDLAGNLISVSQLQEKGILVRTIEDQKCPMVLTRNGFTVATAARIGSQYVLDSVATEATMAAAEGGDPDLDLWHRRFGHIGVQGLRGLYGAVSDLEAPITVPRGHNSDQCEPCIMAKQLRVVNRQKPEKTDEPLGRVFSDFWGPYSIPTLFGERYIWTLTDQATSKSWVFLTRRRSDFREVLLKWIKEVELQTDHKLKVLRLDNAGEFKAIEDELRTKFGIRIEWTTPYTPEQNGVSERLNRTLISLARAMLIDAQLPYKFWGEAVKAICYIRNRTAIGPKGLTPEEAFTGRKPGIKHLRP